MCQKLLHLLTFKAKSEGSQEDNKGWFQKEELLFLPGNLQWKLVNSLHATTHLGEKALTALKKNTQILLDLKEWAGEFSG